MDSDYFKSWVHARVQWPLGESGAWHLASDTTDDYCAQIIAEARVAKASGRVTWVKVKKDNHYLDCEALNAAAAHMLAVHRLQPAPKEATQAKQPQTNQQHRPADPWTINSNGPRKDPGSWWGKYRNRRGGFRR